MPQSINSELPNRYKLYTTLIKRAKFATLRTIRVPHLFKDYEPNLFGDYKNLHSRENYASKPLPFIFLLLKCDQKYQHLLEE